MYARAPPTSPATTSAAATDGLSRLRVGRSPRLVVVAMVAAAALVVGFILVSIVAGVPEVQRSRRSNWPGAGYVVLVAGGIVGLACLVDAVPDGRARRRQGPTVGRDERPGNDAPCR